MLDFLRRSAETAVGALLMQPMFSPSALNRGRLRSGGMAESRGSRKPIDWAVRSRRSSSSSIGTGQR
jgi:hypothetical protein